MKIEILPLPYPKNALAPFIGGETVELHYEKHHKGYLDKLSKLLRGKPEASCDDRRLHLDLAESGDEGLRLQPFLKCPGRVRGIARLDDENERGV